MSAILGGIEMEDKYSLYANAYLNVCQKNKGNTHKIDVLKTLIFYCVKVIITKPKPISYREAYNDFELHSALKQMIERITPKDFMELFPVSKDYDGHKCGAKDYFSTMDYLKTIRLDDPIEDVLELMWNYWNDDIHELNTKMVMNVSKLREMQGNPSLAEEWANENGLQTFTKHTDHAGNEFLIDEQGKSIKVRSHRGSHLRLV